MAETSRAAKKPKTDDIDTVEEMRYVEFYSGVGGWTMALEQAWNNRMDAANNNKLLRVAALENSDLCTKVFEHNFGSCYSSDSSNNIMKNKKAFNIERLKPDQVESWRAQIWVMSPPCQPHTRQHSNQSEDLKDPRSASFLHHCDLLEGMKKPPSILLLENVIGFESSKSFRRWRQVLNDRKYSTAHFHLTPTQAGLPNDRPRHFSVAVLTSKLIRNDGDNNCSTLLSYLTKHRDGTFGDDDDKKITIHTELPEMGVASATSGVDATDNSSSKLPTIASFLDDTSDESLRIPEKIVAKNAAWCFDIVTPKSRRSACFTSSYGKFIKGTGSILYNDNSGKFDLVAPEEREFEGDWASSIDVTKLRYFSGTEMARLMGYPATFSFPNDMPAKQQRKLLGNSLNVQLASKLVEFALRVSEEGG